MNIKILDNSSEIREKFINHFVQSWEDFQINNKEWIAECAQKNCPINIKWYEQAFLWDKISWDFPRVTLSMEEALAFFTDRSDSVLFMSEEYEDTFYQGKELVNFVAEADAHALARQIKKEWYDNYMDRYDYDCFLPQDLYVFDCSMKWCAVFTHETEYWESEVDDPMKAAKSRYCFICEIKH